MPHQIDSALEPLSFLHAPTLRPSYLAKPLRDPPKAGAPPPGVADHHPFFLVSHEPHALSEPSLPGHKPRKPPSHGSRPHASLLANGVKIAALSSRAPRPLSSGHYWGELSPIRVWQPLTVAEIRRQELLLHNAFANPSPSPPPMVKVSPPPVCGCEACSHCYLLHLWTELEESESVAK